MRARGAVWLSVLLLVGALAGCGGVDGRGSQVEEPAGVAESVDVEEPWVEEPAASESGDTQPSRASPDASDVDVGRVTNVVDGDTIDVEGVGRIRVIGIDTPERGACGYDSATAAMSALVLGRDVLLTPGATDDADRYDRLLRYVDVGGGGPGRTDAGLTDAGLTLIEDGWAIARYDSRDGYGPHTREAQYVAADADSKDLGCYPDDEP